MQRLGNAHMENSKYCLKIFYLVFPDFKPSNCSSISNHLIIKFPDTCASKNIPNVNGGLISSSNYILKLFLGKINDLVYIAIWMKFQFCYIISSICKYSKRLYSIGSPKRNTIISSRRSKVITSIAKNC